MKHCVLPQSGTAYAVEMCNHVLGETALTQHRFAGCWGDPGTNGCRAGLLVGACWEGHQLVVGQWELDHDQPISHFDKLHRLTVSCVHRPARGTHGWSMPVTS